MGICGYCGRILRLDLNSGSIKIDDLDARMAKDFLGDTGIGLRLAYDLIKPGIDPLSPENVIIFGAGPLVGLRGMKMTTPRFSVVTKFPLNGVIAFSNGGMHFGIRLKEAGYDHIVITGRSEKPVYLHIFNEKVELCDANSLWGKDILETTNMLWERYGKAYSVIAIGQAGENLTKMALCLIDGIATAGKGGLAAVMGSKNLKAIVVKGTNSIKFADQERLRESIEQILMTFKSNSERSEYLDMPDAMRKFGKMAYFDLYVKRSRIGGLIYKNWSKLYPGDKIIERFGAQTFLNKLERHPTGCPGCTHPCKDIVHIREGEYKDLTVAISSTFGRVINFGIYNDVDSIERVIKCIDIANRYGIDTHLFCPTLSYAAELYEQGIITQKETEGLVLKLEFETIIKLLQQVAYQQGIGRVLGDGVLGIVKRFGEIAEPNAVHIKGFSPQFDPRVSHEGLCLNQFGSIVNPEGAGIKPAHCGYFPVVEGLKDKIDEYCETIGVPEGAKERILNTSFGYNVARLVPYSEDIYIIMNCLGICDHETPYFSFNRLAQIYSAATGNEMNGTEIKKAGERIWSLHKVLNVREGQSRKDDRIPKRWLLPVKNSDGREIPNSSLISTEGKTITENDFERLLDDYYQERGWEVERGIPSKEKLMDLGLEDLAEDLKKMGIYK